MLKNKRKICVVTGSRADYGLLYWLMREIKDDPQLLLQVVVAGMHLSPKFGLTCKSIVKDFKINSRIDMKIKSDSEEAITGSLGHGVIGFSRAFSKLRPDIVVILGDRFEMLAAASAALLFRIPIAHIHGGEITEGAYDDAIRHAITKMAYLHFAACKEYARRIIQLGEHPGRVFCVGAACIDNIKRLRFLSQKVLEKDLGMRLDKDVALVTFHPVTNEKNMSRGYVRNLLQALEKSRLKLIFTMPNADTENKVILEEIRRYMKNNPHKAMFFKSLGELRYLSLMKYAGLMIGNSSSGIIEAPIFRLPVVNIGSRQEGRIKAGNIIDTSYDANSIYRGIEKARSLEFRRSLKNIANFLGSGLPSKKIKNILKKADLTRVKKFYDLR